MLSTYQTVLRLPGAVRFSLAGFIARQPISIIGLGIIVYISSATGSYARAGVLTATFQISAALFALVTSRWVDRFGQGRLLPPLATLHALGLIGFVATVQLGLPFLLQGIVVAIAGASQPCIGAVVRARWAFVVNRDGAPGDLRSAFALESIIDEVIFTLGPILVTWLALQVALPAPLIVSAVRVLAGSVFLAAQRATQPPPVPAPAGAGHRRSALTYPGMVIAFGAAMGLGFVFGSYEVSVVAFTERAGVAGASGIVLALWALGSMMGGLWFGARHWRTPLATQAAICMTLVMIALIPAVLVRSVPMLTLVTFIGGAAVAPALITGFSLAERLVPTERLTEGLTWATSGLSLGLSGGAAVAGFVIDAAGTTVSFLLPIAGAAAATAILWLRRPRLNAVIRPYGESEPAIVSAPDPIPGPAPGAIVDDAP